MKAILRHAMMKNLFSDMCSKVCKDTKKSEEFMKQIEIVFEKKWNVSKWPTSNLL